MTNWKTTVIGFGAAILNLVANGATWQAAAVSVGLAALGTVAKDSDVTGGRREQ